MLSVLTHCRGTLLYLSCIFVLSSGQAHGQFTTIFNIPPDMAPSSIGSNTQLNLFDGGIVGAFFDAGLLDGTSTNVEVNIFGGTVGDYFHAFRGSMVNISGGSVGMRFRATGSTVNISGGSVGRQFDAFGGTVNISGGSVGSFFDAIGSTVNILGGTVLSDFNADNGSTVNISGGSVGVNLSARNASTVNISGGSIGGSFSADSGSMVTISGGEFRIDGDLLEGLDTVGDTLAVNLPAGVVLHGTLADGRPIAFSDFDADMIRNGTLVLQAAVLPDIGPQVIMLPGDPAPLGVRPGQTLVVDDGGIVGDDLGAGWGSSVNILPGGSVGDNFEAVGASVNIAGGSVGEGFDAFHGSTVNMSGGTVDRNFDANGGSTVNISGGSIRWLFSARNGSRVNISGGSAGDYFFALSGSKVNISGGSVGDLFQAIAGSTVTLPGGEFRLDGAIIEGLDRAGNTLGVDLPRGAVLSGTFADGTPFAFSSLDRDSIANGTLTLEAAALPAIGPPVITLPGDAAPQGIRAGQTVVVKSGGALPDHFSAGRGSTVIVEPGASVGHNLEAVDALVEISGGTIGASFDAFGGSTVNIAGGSFGQRFEAYDGSRVNISGGLFGDFFRTATGSAVNLSGGEFRLDGAIIEGLDTVGNTLGVDLPRGAVLSGTLADGTPFAFSDLDHDAIANRTLTLEAADLPAIGPRLITLPGDTAPHGIRAGQTVIVKGGGTLPVNFSAGRGSTVIVEPGASVGDNLEAVDALVEISGGSVAGRIDAIGGTTVNISGGSIGRGLDAYDGSTVNISGGTFDNSTGALDAFAGSTINLIGTRFSLNFRDITPSLTPDVPFTIHDRDVRLFALLADGSRLEFVLYSNDKTGREFFHPDATLTVTLVSLLLAGDTNGDGVVNVDDLNNVRNNFGAVGPDDGTLAGDAYPFDGMVDIDDLNNVRNNFGRQNVEGQPVPETVAIGLLSWGLIAVAVVGRRRRRHSQAIR